MSRESIHLLDDFLSNNVVRLARKYTLHGRLYLEHHSDVSFDDWRLLVRLERLIQPSMDELCHLLDWETDRLTRVSDGLLERGLVRFVRDTATERLALTEAGDGLFETTLTTMQRRQTELLADVDPDEARLFLEILHRLEDGVDASIAELKVAETSSSAEATG